MAETTVYNLADSQLPDNTIDFYILLGEPTNAPTEVLRAKIGAIYAEAQANRDHRNLKKRNEYKTLLELLPPARVALLEAPKRAKYDDFLAKAKRGEAPEDFETFINDLMGFNEPMEEKTGLPTLKQDVRSSSGAATVSSSSSARSAPTASSGSPRPGAKSAGGASNTALIAAIVGFLIGAVLGFLWKGLVPAILLGIIIGAIAFVALNSKSGKKVKM